MPFKLFKLLFCLAAGSCFFLSADGLTAVSRLAGSLVQAAKYGDTHLQFRDYLLFIF